MFSANPWIPLTTIVASTSVIIVLFGRFKQRNKNIQVRDAPNVPPMPTRPRPMDICRTVIRALPVSVTLQNTLPATVSRILPFGKTQIAFDIDNPLTTRDRRYRDQFNSDLLGLMNLTEEEYMDLSIFIGAQAVDLYQYLSMPVWGGDCEVLEVNFTTLVQAITMKIIMWLFLDMKDTGLERGTTIALVVELNRTIKSAESIETLTPLSTNHHLKQALTDALDLEFTFLDPKANPFNWILPAYGPLWLAIMATFIEATSNRSLFQAAWAETLADYSQAPTFDQFNAPHVQSEDTASTIVRESLRLHPPVREIRRTYKLDQHDTKMTDVHANIEDRLTSASTFGEDAATFNPHRTRNVTGEQANTFLLSFGGFPYRCPASHFAPRLIGLTVGCLIRASASAYQETGQRWQGRVEYTLDGNINMRNMLENGLFMTWT